MVSGNSSRRRFVRTLATIGAAGGAAALLHGRVTEKPLIQLAQAASGDYMFKDYANTSAGTTELDSDLTTGTDTGFKVVASATSGTMRGIYGESAADDGIGVYGIATATTSSLGMTPRGLYGRVDTNGGTWPDGPWPTAVEGYAAGSSGAAFGVRGHADSPDGDGVVGEAPGVGVFGVGGIWGGGHANGIVGELMSPDGAGVLGYGISTTGTVNGVVGQTYSPDGYGVEGYAAASLSASGNAAGVYGHTDAPNTAGVRGIATASSSNMYHDAGGAGRYTAGVEGYAPGGIDGPVQGVYGHSDSMEGCGVWGVATATSGEGSGVIGYTQSPYGAGVFGRSLVTSGWAAGVAGKTNSPDGYGVWGWNSGWDSALTTGYGSGVFGQSDSSNGSGVQGVARANGCVGVLGQAASGWPDAIPIVARGTTDQTAPLQEWVRSDWTRLAVVDKDGNFGIGTATPVRQLHIRGSNAVARLDRDVDSASFIFTRTAASNFGQVWKTFTFGVKATGVDSGSFFIGDMHTNVSGSSDNRLLIDTNGNVGIGTTTPSSKLHVAGRVKALGYDTGDIRFANGVRATEEGKGLAFLSDDGEKIAVLDHEGNFHIKGDIIKDL